MASRTWSGLRYRRFFVSLSQPHARASPSVMATVANEANHDPTVPMPIDSYWGSVSATMKKPTASDGIALLISGGLHTTRFSEKIR